MTGESGDFSDHFCSPDDFFSSRGIECVSCTERLSIHFKWDSDEKIWDRSLELGTLTVEVCGRLTTGTAVWSLISPLGCSTWRRWLWITKQKFQCLIAKLLHIIANVNAHKEIKTLYNQNQINKPQRPSSKAKTFDIIKTLEQWVCIKIMSMIHYSIHPIIHTSCPTLSPSHPPSKPFFFFFFFFYFIFIFLRSQAVWLRKTDQLFPE